MTVTRGQRAAETAVILNSRSGSLIGGRTDPIETRIQDALAAQGGRVSIHRADGGSIAAAVRDAVERGVSMLIVGGGDGTLRTAVRLLVGTDVTLGLLPLGTMNLLARRLGIPGDLDQALSVIGAGHRRRIDLAFVNREPFAVMAMVGPMTAAAVIRERERGAPELVRWTRTTASALSLWRRHGRTAMRIGNGRETRRLETSLVLVSNRRLTGDLTDPLAARRESQGLLHAYAAPPSARALIDPESLMAASRSWLGRGVLDHWRLLSGRRVTLSTPRAYSLITLDGELQAMRGPLVFSTMRQCLSVFMPAAPGVNARDEGTG